MFKFDLQDDKYKSDAISTGKPYQIEVTCFKETIDIFFDKVQVGATYEISGPWITKSNRKFSGINNDWRLILNKETVLKQTSAEIAKPVPSSVTNEQLFMKLDDIVAYTRTLVKSGIL